jgi:redox-sensitive bicupin YhaK (pirin superfamily)
MTAGHGVLHSEMPHGDGTAHTLQLWLNLAAKMKMIPARYQDQRLKEGARLGQEVSRFPLCARGPRTDRRHRSGEGDVA